MDLRFNQDDAFFVHDGINPAPGDDEPILSDPMPESDDEDEDDEDEDEDIEDILEEDVEDE